MTEAVKTRAVSVRLTAEERAALAGVAGPAGVSAYIRGRVFGGSAGCACASKPVMDADPPSAPPELALAEMTQGAEDRLSPQARQRLLARILAQLGASGALASLADLAALAREGGLYLSTDDLAVLHATLAEVRALRGDLLRALGKRPRPLRPAEAHRPARDTP